MAKLTVRLEFDAELEHPSYFEPGWMLHSFSGRHCAYAHPTALGLSTQLDARTRLPRADDRKLADQLESGLAHFLSYYWQPGHLWFRAAGPLPAGIERVWDGVRVDGLLVWACDPRTLPAQTFAARAAAADAYLELYSSWSNGCGLAYTIEDARGKTIDAGGGFYGCEVEYMLAEVARKLTKHTFVVAGAAKNLEKELRALTGRAAAKKPVRAS